MTSSKIIAVLASLILAFSLGCGDDDDTPVQKDKGTGQQDVGGTQKDMGGPDQATSDQATSDLATSDQATPDTGSSTSCSASCHAFPPATGKHAKHVGKGMKCAACHSEVVDSSDKIISTTKHKNGTKDVKGSFTWDGTGKSCSSLSCHGTKSW